MPHKDRKARNRDRRLWYRRNLAKMRRYFLAKRKEWIKRHRKRELSNRAAWRKKNRAKLRAKKLADRKRRASRGQCFDCPRKAQKGRRYCGKCQQKRRQATVRRHDRDPEFRRRRHARERYGLSWEQVERMRKRQKCRCAICKNPEPIPPTRRTRLHIDHDHKTTKARALLCSKCNTAVETVELGKTLRNRDLLKKVLAYLKKYK